MLIAVDHGNKQIKTVHTPPFTSGLIQSDTPGFGTDALAYHQLWDTDSDTVTRSCESTIYSGSSNRFIFTTIGETGTESSRSRGLRG